MDNIGEIILVVIVLIGSIVQQIYKATKKAKNRAGTVIEHHRDDSQWGNERETVFSAPVMESRDVSYKLEDHYFHYDTVDNSQESPLNTIQSIKMPEISQLNSTNTIDEIPSNRMNEILGEFELDKAIIYSEILNPKFKEY